MLCGSQVLTRLAALAMTLVLPLPLTPYSTIGSLQVPLTYASTRAMMSWRPRNVSTLQRNTKTTRLELLPSRRRAHTSCRLQRTESGAGRGRGATNRTGTTCMTKKGQIVFRVVFLPVQKVFLPGQRQKVVKTWQKRLLPAKSGKN